MVMNFLLEQFRQLVMVAVIMICAIGGTIGILKIIKKITPGDGFPQDPISRKLEEESKKRNS